VTENVMRLEWSLYPEILVNEYTRLGAIRPLALSGFVFGMLLMTGSFIWAAPILLFNYIWKRIRSSAFSGWGF
jgi:hypothetical protein